MRYTTKKYTKNVHFLTFFRSSQVHPNNPVPNAPAFKHSVATAQTVINLSLSYQTDLKPPSPPPPSGRLKGPTSGIIWRPPAEIQPQLWDPLQHPRLRQTRLLLFLGTLLPSWMLSPTVQIYSRIYTTWSATKRVRCGTEKSNCNKTVHLVTVMKCSFYTRKGHTNF